METSNSGANHDVLHAQNDKRGLGPSGVVHAKQRLLDQNYKSLWVPDIACCFVHAKQRV